MEEQVNFPVGDLMLEGLLFLPAPAPRIGVVVCHPHPLYGGEMRDNIVSALVDGFRAAGMATLRFNFRGVGNSTGEHDEGHGELDDVRGAVTYLLNRRAVPTVVVAGYSFGSMVGMQAGAGDPRVHKLIGVALPIKAHDPAFLSSVTKPKLLISGDRDDYSPTAEFNRLVAGLADPKASVIIDGADHFFGGYEAEVANAAAAFLSEPSG